MPFRVSKYLATRSVSNLAAGLRMPGLLLRRAHYERLCSKFSGCGNTQPSQVDTSAGSFAFGDEPNLAQVDYSAFTPTWVRLDRNAHN